MYVRALWQMCLSLARGRIALVTLFSLTTLQKVIVFFLLSFKMFPFVSETKQNKCRIRIILDSFQPKKMCIRIYMYDAIVDMRWLITSVVLRASAKMIHHSLAPWCTPGPNNTSHEIVQWSIYVCVLHRTDIKQSVQYIWHNMNVKHIFVFWIIGRI